MSARGSDFASRRQGKENNSSPSAHDIRIPTKDLAQTADHDIRILRHLDIDKIANRLVDHHDEAVFVGQLTDAGQVRTGQKRITGELAKQREERSLAPFPALFAQLLERGNVLRAAVTEEMTPVAPFLEDLEGICVWESARQVGSFSVMREQSDVPIAHALPLSARPPPGHPSNIMRMPNRAHTRRIQVDIVRRQTLPAIASTSRDIRNLAIVFVARQ